MESIGDQMRDSLPETENIYDVTPAEKAAPETANPEPASEVPEDDPLKAMQEATKDSDKK